MGKKVQLCAHCNEPVGESHLTVHAAKGPVGVFHVDRCFPAAFSEAQKAPDVVSVARLHDDVELVRGRD